MGSRGARFVFIAGPVAIGSGDPSQHVWWRVASANNRILGRSAGDFATIDDCRAHASELQRGVDDVVASLASTSGGRWAWSVAMNSILTARSTRQFPRRIDCVRGLGLFLAAARSADVDGVDVRYFAPARPVIDDAVSAVRP